MATTPPPDTGVPTCYRHPGREAHIRCQRCNRSICPDCMNSAAVGFQCPDCVRAGRRETRQGQAAYGGRPVVDASLTTYVLIVLNAVVFAIIFLTGRYNSRLLDLFGLLPTGRCAVDGGYYPGEGSAGVCHADHPNAHWVHGVSDGSYWQLITAAFTHVEVWHIGANMLALWIIGPQVELVLGRVRFLAVYLISALAGSVAVYWLAGEATQTVGASGAIFGLFGAMLVIVKKVRAPLRPILMVLGINAVITFSVPGISWQGHVGGCIGGALVAAILAYSPRGKHRAAIQLGGLTALVVVLLALVAVRTAALA